MRGVALSIIFLALAVPELSPLRSEAEMELNGLIELIILVGAIVCIIFGK